MFFERVGRSVHLTQAPDAQCFLVYHQTKISEPLFLRTRAVNVIERVSLALNLVLRHSFFRVMVPGFRPPTSHLPPPPRSAGSRGLSCLSFSAIMFGECEKNQWISRMDIVNYICSARCQWNGNCPKCKMKPTS